MILQDIKETKRYGHTHTRSEGQRENSIPTHIVFAVGITQFAGGGGGGGGGGGEIIMKYVNRIDNKFK